MISDRIKSMSFGRKYVDMTPAQYADMRREQIKIVIKGLIVLSLLLIGIWYIYGKVIERKQAMSTYPMQYYGVSYDGKSQTFERGKK
jgi:hypothetical protein